MTEKQLLDLVEDNKCKEIQIEDSAGNKLYNIHGCATAQAAADELREALKTFKEYRKLNILARVNDSTTWGNAFCWTFRYDTDAASKKDGTIAGTESNGSIGAMAYIQSWTAQESRINELHRKNLELEMKLKEQDPNKWMPIIQMAGSALGLEMQGGIAGPQVKEKKKLMLGDIDTSKMNDEQITERVGEGLAKLAKKIKGSQMYNVVYSLNEIPELNKNVDKIATLLNALGKNPDLIDIALKYIK
jgi:hypothetical protein